ncbi:hypothetical protein IW262DRAFT_1467225 [Armillaria fumosa]|nr:hypothetical protein IW262DRAFT_1467225 [Armillaria fumosa]
MDHWMPIHLSLYQMPTSSNIISHLQTHAATLHAMGKKPSQSQALAAATPMAACGCHNPDCKACDKTHHAIENCYWPSGGKEGQFPSNFSHPHYANQANSNNMADITRHFVLVACATTVNADRDDDGLVIEDRSTGERIFEWNKLSTKFSDWSFNFGSDTESFTDVRDDTDLEMPSLTSIDDNDEKEERLDDNNNETLLLVDTDFNDDKVTRQYVCEADPARNVFAITTFEGCTPAVTLTFVNSGASDYFFQNYDNFTEYTPVVFYMGSSAIEEKGTFEILGQGTVTKIFRLNGSVRPGPIFRGQG